MKTALIFDLDGTLLDSMDDWNNLDFEYLRSKGVTDIPPNINELIKAMSIIGAAEFFIEKFGLSLSAEEVCDEINAIIEDKYRYHIPLKDGVWEFLKQNTDKKMCVATATDRYLAESALKRLGIFDYFEFIITSADVGSSKQSAEIFLKAAEKLGRDISDCIVFEDALHAVITAKSAGFYTVGVYEKSFETDRNDIKRHADQYVTHLSEVII